LVATLKLEKNIIAAKKVQLSPSRMFDPQGMASQESKKEGGIENNKILVRFVDLLQALSNKMIRLEKNLQSPDKSVNISAKQPPPKRPFWQEKKVETSRVPVPMFENNFAGTLLPVIIVEFVNCSITKRVVGCFPK